MTGFFRRFRLHSSSPDFVATSEQDHSSSSPVFSHIQFRIHDDPTPPNHPVGSFQHDLASGKYQNRWETWAAFEKWLASEKTANAIEFRLVNIYTESELYIRKLRYVCSRAGTGGQKAYTKLHPDWNRKRGPKRTDCKCTLIVKQYLDVLAVLGNYSDTHNHDLGNANLPFTQIPKAAREHIAGLLRMKVAPEHILKMMHRGAYDKDDLFEQDLDANFVAERTEFIVLRDIRRIEKGIEAEAVRLHPDDGQSTMRWVENLRNKGHLLGFKWGHGIPIAWMLASNGSQVTITFFLRANKSRSPLTISRHIISDFCWPQINACIEIYNAIIFLCWWHVLHAWQQHFSIPAHPELWELLKNWIRITDQTEFDATWIKIQSMAPQGFVKYLTDYWMRQDVVKMWSAVFRTSRSIFENCNTNMLIEAWYSVLKDLGFEGPDLELKKRQDILERSRVYVKSDIVQVEDSESRFLVPSKSQPSRVYEVDIDTYTCTCLDYPLISFCKHISAVQNQFDEPGGPPDGVRPSPQVPSLPCFPCPSDTASRASNGPKLHPLTIVAKERHGSRVHPRVCTRG
ncbi:hypothetical protein B0H11DRAFT_1720367 [Mycena galericulata]|nr:hypothetical protein B0H11DRAFT_1720367 [Mycena galericulata]